MKKPNYLQMAFKPLQSPQGLLEAILAHIGIARRRAARVRAALLGCVSLVSAILLIPTVQYAAQEFYTSGFSTYASLLLSDQDAVRASWHAFSLSLIESLPSIAILLLIALCSALLWSLHRLVRIIPAAFSPRLGV